MSTKRAQLSGLLERDCFDSFKAARKLREKMILLCWFFFCSSARFSLSHEKEIFLCYRRNRPAKIFLAHHNNRSHSDAPNLILFMTRNQTSSEWKFEVFSHSSQERPFTSQRIWYVFNLFLWLSAAACWLIACFSYPYRGTFQSERKLFFIVQLVKV